MDLIRQKIENIIGPKHVFANEDMSLHTSFKAGGCADILVEPQNITELREVIKVLKDTPHVILGNGSNILVRDGGYRGVIIKIGNAFDYIKAQGDTLVCGAGSLLSTAAKTAASNSLEGFEFASGIPGSIGGAVFMNAGAYDGEIKNILSEVHLVSSDGNREFTLTGEELQMGYRHTLLSDTGDIVIEARFKLTPGEESEIKGRMSELAKKRNSKQPVQFPSAGSFFKRPEGYFAGKLVQDAGCKGLNVGGAEVSSLHSGFIINTGKATATDILQLKELVQARVMDKFGVMLEPEVQIIGEEASSKPQLKYRMLYDLHTHTTYSHGSGSVEDNVRSALDKGLEYVAISDHGPGHLFYGVNRNDFVNIRNDIDKMNVKYQSINVRNSIEANIVHAKGKQSNGLDIRPEEFEEFDFVIAGFHFGCFNCSSIRNWLWSHGFKLGEKSLRKSNTRMIVDALRLNNIAILTHPGDKGPFDIMEIAKACKETDTLIEINSRHGHLTAEEIKIAMEVEGLKFVISSDAHTPDAVGLFSGALKRATDAGLDISRIVNITGEKE